MEDTTRTCSNTILILIIATLAGIIILLYLNSCRFFLNKLFVRLRKIVKCSRSVHSSFHTLVGVRVKQTNSVTADRFTGHIWRVTPVDVRAVRLNIRGSQNLPMSWWSTCRINVIFQLIFKVMYALICHYSNLIPRPYRFPDFQPCMHVSHAYVE